MPAEAPSRAYRKVVEGLLWTGARIEPGDLALDVGAAPGGSTLALLERGARVVAVDAQPLADAVRARPDLTVLDRPIGQVALEELPRGFRWITCDASIPPAHALRALRRVVAPNRKTLRGVLWTLKLHDEAAVAGIPRFLEQVRAMGARAVQARQLPANRRDILVFADMR